LKTLLEAGANVNTFNNYGTTALIIAALNSNVEVVKILLKSGTVIISTEHDRNKELVRALFYGNFEVAKLLGEARGLFLFA